MNKIWSTCRLDFYTIKPYFKSLLLLFGIAVFMTGAFQSLSTPSFYLMMCLILVTIYPFSIGEMNRLDTLYATLPLKRKDIVTGRHLFLVCMELMTVALVLILVFGFSLFTEMEFVLPELLFYLSLASFVFTVTVSLQYPIYFKLGYNKAKFLAYVPLLLISVSVVLFSDQLKNLGLAQVSFDEIMYLIGGSPVLTYLLPVLLGHVILALSCGVSCRLYEKRDL